VTKSFQHRGSIRLAIVFVLMAFAAKPAQPQKFKVLHTFHGPNGVLPAAQLTLDADGNIYGTTELGGGKSCPISGSGCGTVFKLDKNGSQLWLYRFNLVNGAAPRAALVRDGAGNLYGTTMYGGVKSRACSANDQRICGVVFKLDPAGKKETVLYKFKGWPDGEFPGYGPLVSDGAGSWVSTTSDGGTYTYGTVFRMDSLPLRSNLHSFAGQPGDGQNSGAGVIRDAAGNLYGVAAGGSNENGTVFKIDTNGVETLLYNFTGGADGSGSGSVLIADSAGNLYGTIIGGGSYKGMCGGLGCGVVFELSPQSGGNWKESTLYTFHYSDGQFPEAGPLVRDAKGNLYGTAMFGGVGTGCNGYPCGLVFEIDPAGKQTVLHNFTGGPDGADPFGGLVMDKAGNLYGTTLNGGDLKCAAENGNGCGVVFEITP